MQGLFQLASITHPLGKDKPDFASYQVIGRAPIQVDRVQARLVVEPDSSGKVPDDSLISALERSIRFKLSLDRNDVKMVTIGDVPVCSLQNMGQGGPVPVQPFRLSVGEECKVQTRIHPNLYNAAIFKDYPGVSLEILFYGCEL